MSAQSGGMGWALRIHAACDWVLWALRLNLLWIVFTLAGGVLLGAAPAAVASAHVTRRRLRGELFPVWGEFARTWRQEFVPANLVAGPALVVSTLLAIRATSLVLSGASDPASFVVIAAGCFAVTLTAVLVPLYVHYDLPPRRYLLTASRWLLRNLAHGLVVLAVAVLIGAASAALPGLLPFVSVGAWLSASTALCLAFFAANDEALAEQGGRAPVAAGTAA